MEHSLLVFARGYPRMAVPPLSPPTIFSTSSRSLSCLSSRILMVQSSVAHSPMLGGIRSSTISVTPKVRLAEYNYFSQFILMIHFSYRWNTCSCHRCYIWFETISSQLSPGYKTRCHRIPYKMGRRRQRPTDLLAQRPRGLWKICNIARNR